MTAVWMVLALQAETIQQIVASLDGRVELVSELPASLDVGREYKLKVRITNTGVTPLPGIPVAEITSGKPTLFVGWGFTETTEEAFGFLGAVQIESPLAPGESREVALAVTAKDPTLAVFRMQLWVSRNEAAGLVGGAVGPSFAREIELPISFRDASRTALLFALAICNAFFLGYLWLDARLKKRAAKPA